MTNNHYRPKPFWSWNDRLNIDETVRQVRLMHEAGLGGFFIHARGGLQTQYMGQEWFDNIEAAIAESEKFNMEVWIYDEYGWPSGFGSGKINSKGADFQQKFLRFEKREGKSKNTIINLNGYHYFYEINPFYVDLLDDKVTKEFIKEIYEPYYKRFGNRIKGFFTDEPQLSRNGIPWSLILPEEYESIYGEELFMHLEELFRPVGNYETTRFRFWKTVTDLFSKNYFEQIYNWCDKRGLKLTGHLLLEQTMQTQLTSNGAVMPHYEYFHIPGMDWLGKRKGDILTPLQVSSVAQQLGRKQVLSESFACCGNNVSFDELKSIFEIQMLHGVNLLCQHLQGYSLRGLRKRDHPPAMYYQQPWWDYYKYFNDYITAEGKVLSEGTMECDTLLIHPQSTAWICYDGTDNAELKKYDLAFLNAAETLEKKHIPFHLGDETIMERYGSVEGSALIVGKQKYKTVILPPHKILFESTKGLLKEFEENGGVIMTAEQAEPDNTVDNENVGYTKREYMGSEICFFVNKTDEEQKAKIMGKEYIFMPFETLSVFDGDFESKSEKSNYLMLDGKWQIKNCTENILVLDFCDYYFDGRLIEKNGYVLNIQQRACNLKKPINIVCDYKVNVLSVPDKVYLVCETPEKYRISINGKKIDVKDCGCFIDISFKKLNISGYLKKGRNTVRLENDFVQSEDIYKNLEQAQYFEGMKNKLTYDTEIEPIYITGNFSVETKGQFKTIGINSTRFSGNFSIGAPETEIELGDIVKQGFPFFAGTMTLSKKIKVFDTNQRICFRKSGINALEMKINGQKVKPIIWEPMDIDISKKLIPGENEVEITIANNLRNFLGPHHIAQGEPEGTGPNSFYKEACVWNHGCMIPWDKDYCFVETGIKQRNYDNKPAVSVTSEDSEASPVLKNKSTCERSPKKVFMQGGN